MRALLIRSRTTKHHRWVHVFVEKEGIPGPFWRAWLGGREGPTTCIICDFSPIHAVLVGFQGNTEGPGP